MAKFWVMDICPPGDACIFEQNADGRGFRQAVRYCEFHLTIAVANALTDEEVFAAQVQSMALKEISREVVRQSLGLQAKPRCEVNEKGEFTILVDEAADKTSLQSSVDTELGKITMKPGAIGKVIVSDVTPDVTPVGSSRRLTDEEVFAAQVQSMALQSSRRVA